MKRLIICLDGTWNDDRKGLRPTNVAKIQRAIAPVDANGVQQISHYCSGIASGESETLSFLKGAVGYGVAERIQHAYTLIADAYAAGDEIYLFGFSRGAFEARSLAAFIALFGVGRKDRGFAWEAAWAQYRLPEGKRNAQALSELRAAAIYPVRIRCLGVWDTVGNIGNPFSSGTWLSRSLSFHDMRLTDAVEVGLHALSVDEQRGPFRPALWTLPEGQPLAAHQTVEQVWFPGSHCDVGGGFRETALSDVALMWMVERVKALTGLGFDKTVLDATCYPDPLGAQHSSNTGHIFRWSGWLPFVRLVQQAQDAVSPLRRRLIGMWRTGRVAAGQKVVNESLHESVRQRYGQKVIELINGRSHLITYRPANLVPILTEPVSPAKARDDAQRRVKIITVHGTFAYETDWDNWKSGEQSAASPPVAFINQLSDRLRERGILLEEGDHSQYNWSGGNSHDERRTAAIGLKKQIEHELAEAHEKKGADYYDGVYLIGHSHGGTISRLAMNLWGKDYDYYDPELTDARDEFKHDDTCDTCKRARNGRVAPSRLRRPDGVFTFGSPFVTFETRRGGLLTARLAAWSFRALVVLPILMLLAVAWFLGPTAATSTVWKLTPGFLQSLILVAWPVAVYWLFGSLSGVLVAAVERWFGKTNVLFATSAAVQSVKYLMLVAAAVYYYFYATGQTDRLLAMPPFDDAAMQGWLSWLVLLAFALGLLVLLPGAFLRWLRRSVVPLKTRLPTKYDPAEDRPTAYVNYHTPGDEAGLGLRVFGILTWTVQTLALATATVLVIGFLLMIPSLIEALRAFGGTNSLFEGTGVSPISDFPEERDRFIGLVNGVTWLPKFVWSDWLGASWLQPLGDLENRREVAWYMPLAILISTLTISLILMPFVAIAIALAYLVSIWLRGSGLVFGSEKLAWTIANNIKVRRLANETSTLRLMFITPEAWWRREIAHCYYYRSPRVIDDMAARIADWQSNEPTPSWPVGPVLATAGRVLVVVLFVASIFLVSVLTATSLVSLRDQEPFAFLGGFLPADLTGGPGSLPDPKDADQYTGRGQKYMKLKHYDRALADLSKAVELAPTSTVAYQVRGQTYTEKGDPGLALADFTKAIEIDPKQPSSYNIRGHFFQKQGDLDKAIGDFSTAVTLDPSYVLGFMSRASAYRAKGDFDAAIADYTTLVTLDASNAKAFLGRGMAHIEKGDIELARADFAKAAEVQGSDWNKLVLAAVTYGNGDYQAAAQLASVPGSDHAMYRALFRYLARTRAGEPAAKDLEADVATLGSKAWPYPVSELYLGKRTPAALVAAAASPGETCEAHYYVSQWYALKNQTVDAKAGLEAAVKACPITFVEYLAAKTELARLAK